MKIEKNKHFHRIKVTHTFDMLGSCYIKMTQILFKHFWKNLQKMSL